MTLRELLLVVIFLVWFALCAFAAVTAQAADRWIAKNKNSDKKKPWYVRFWGWALEIDQ